MVFVSWNFLVVVEKEPSPSKYGIFVELFLLKSYFICFIVLHMILSKSVYITQVWISIN